MLIGKSKLISELKQAARYSPADQTLIACQHSRQTIFRFSGGKIHQNFSEQDITVWVKTSWHGRVGVATCSSLTKEALRRAVDAALAIAKLSGKSTAASFQTAPLKKSLPALQTHFARTAHQPPEERLTLLKNLWLTAEKTGLELAGSSTAGESELAVVGSGGLVAYQPFTAGGLRLVTTRGKSSGFAAQSYRDAETLDADELLKRASDHCRRNRNQKKIPLGKYTVLIEPEAVAELAEWLSYIGFGAKQFYEKSSFMAGRIGDKIMGDNITIRDDATDPAGLSMPFDFEGVPRKNVGLIEKGRAQRLVYDSHYGKLYHQPSTGHALPYDEAEGPIATHLLVEPGKTPAAAMLKKMDHGLWITRFHYVSGLLDTREALMTGLTRDGSFIVEKGKVVGAAKTLRFTQPVLKAFSQVIALSKERRLVADPTQGFSSVVAPAMLIRDFTFTGQTR